MTAGSREREPKTPVRLRAPAGFSPAGMTAMPTRLAGRPTLPAACRRPWRRACPKTAARACGRMRRPPAAPTEPAGHRRWPPRTAQTWSGRQQRRLRGQAPSRALRRMRPAKRQRASAAVRTGTGRRKPAAPQRETRQAARTEPRPLPQLPPQAKPCQMAPPPLRKRHGPPRLAPTSRHRPR